MIQTESAGPDRPTKPVGCVGILKRGIVGLCLALGLLLLIGAAYQSLAIRQDLQRYEPRGELFQVDGHEMHLTCLGEGTPVVILQAGATAESLWWHWVQQQLSPHSMVCAYDRPGMGWSEPASAPRDPDTINAELDLLLRQADVPGPYIVVGHSYGAIVTRVFAATYPHQVVGAVLVDSQLVSPKSFANQAEVDQNRTYWDLVGGVSSALTRFGVTRIASVRSLAAAGYPIGLVPEMAGLQARQQAAATYYAENGPAFVSLQTASASAENLGDLPLVVIWAASTYAQNSGNPSLRPLTEELAGYSSNSTLVIIEGANHGSVLGTEALAQQVSDEILNLVRAARNDRPAVFE
jgi:pimeloyl-ACP methyl ester carboxylesterase